jgi:exodeoxyribonuclease V gamma subunit
VAARLLDARLNGFTTDDWAARERASGTVPAGGLGDRNLVEIATQVDDLLAAAAGLGIEPRADDPQPIDVQLPDGTRVVGEVDRCCGQRRPGPGRITFSKAQPKQHLAGWLDLVALVAHDPEPDWRSVIVRRADRSGPVSPPDPLELLARGEDAEDRRARALAALAVVVDLWRRGQTEPLPLFPKLSPKLHEQTARPYDWSHSDRFCEAMDEEHVLAFGSIEFRELTEIPARDDDPPGDAPGRATRFADYLWTAVEASACTRAEADAEDAAGPEPRLEIESGPAPAPDDESTAAALEESVP